MDFCHCSISLRKVVCVIFCFREKAYVSVSFFYYCMSAIADVFAGPFQGLEVEIVMVGSLANLSQCWASKVCFMRTCYIIRVIRRLKMIFPVQCQVSSWDGFGKPRKMKLHCALH